MIELFEQNERKADRQSSKGNQLKWENNGIWYKADCTGYEGLAEYMISHLLKFSSLQKDEFVLYDYERIKYKNIFYNVCNPVYGDIFTHKTKAAPFARFRTKRQRRRLVKKIE